MDRYAQVGDGAHAGLEGTRAVPQLVDAALTGRSTLLLLLGRDGNDVHSVIRTLVRPAVIARGIDDSSTLEAAGLAWERDRPFGVLDRLGIDRENPVEALQDLAADGPLLVLITEAGDADPESLQALSSAVHRLSDAPVLILVAGVTADLDNAESPLADLRRAHRRTSCVVDATDAVGVRTLAAGLGVLLDEATSRRVCRHTEGSPSQVIELLNLPDKSYLKSPDTPLPATPSVRRRVDRALAIGGPLVRRLAEACAILGRWSVVEDLSAVADIPDPLTLIDRAVALDVLRVRRVSLRLEVGFPSRLVRAAIYECMGVARQRELHRRAAAVLSEPGAVLRQRALAAGGPDDSIATALEEYAVSCAAQGGWDPAAQAWLAASRLSEQQAAGELRLVRSVDAKISAGHLLEAQELMPELESTQVSAERDAVLGFHQLLLGHHDEAEVMLGRAWKVAEELGNAEARAKVAHRRALHSLVDWDAEALIHWSEEILAGESDDAARLEAQAIYGLGLGGAGRIQEALAAYAKITGEVHAGAHGQQAMLGQGWLHLAQDRIPLGAHELEMAAPTNPWHGSSRISLWANAWLAHARLMLGDLRAAQAAVDRAVPMLEETGQNIVLPLVHWAGAQLAALRGDIDLAEQHAAYATSVRTDYQGMMVAATMARASVAQACGDYAGVLRAFEPLLAAGRHPGLDEPGFWPWQDTYAMALVATGDDATADAFLVPHEKLAAAREHRSTMARLGGVRARIQIHGGDLALGRETFEWALGLISDLPMPWLRTRLHFVYGQSLRRAGKRRDAEAELYRARRGYAAIGAGGYMERCDRELKAGSRTRDVASLTELTPQEQAVVELVLQGMTNREVAASLFISIKTVQYHLTRVYARLGVRSRAELAALRLSA